MNWRSLRVCVILRVWIRERGLRAVRLSSEMFSSLFSSLHLFIYLKKEIILWITTQWPCSTLLSYIDLYRALGEWPTFPIL